MRSPALFVLALVFCGVAAVPPAAAEGVRESITAGGKQITYRARPGTIDLTKNGRVRGTMFYTAYQREGLNAKQLKKRPVVFLFNGGPGSSSAWLHLGAFGPQRLVLGKAGLTKPDAPYRTVENEHSLIDVADLVFIDPIGTGFSRAADAIVARSFYSFRGDVRSVAEFIKRYLDQEKRVAAPCIIIGESYGAMRACGLAPELEEKHGIVVNGLVLVSGPIVMGRGSTPDLILPTAAATAHYHGLLDKHLQVLDRARLVAMVDEFVEKAYRPALDGERIDDETRDQIAGQVRAFTGLPRLRGLSFSLRELRVNTLRQIGVESIGYYDTRVVSRNRRGPFRGATGDPAMEVIRDPMDAVMQKYLTTSLGYQSDLEYRLLNRIAIWSHAGSKASDTLTRALQTNRGLQVFVASGYYDTITPMAVVRRAVEDAKFGPGQRDNVRFKAYEGGHMMYTNLPALEELSRDVRDFVRRSAKRKRGPALVPILAD